MDFIQLHQLVFRPIAQLINPTRLNLTRLLVLNLVVL